MLQFAGSQDYRSPSWLIILQNVFERHTHFFALSCLRVSENIFRQRPDKWSIETTTRSNDLFRFRKLGKVVKTAPKHRSYTMRTKKTITLKNKFLVRLKISHAFPNFFNLIVFQFFCLFVFFHTLFLTRSRIAFARTCLSLILFRRFIFFDTHISAATLVQRFGKNTKQCVRFQL